MPELLPRFKANTQRLEDEKKITAIVVESDRHAGVIIAHLPRDPLHLYPELAERGWSATRLDGDPGEVRIRLQRLPA